jgi:ketosteroid isomerase-like protein
VSGSGGGRFASPAEAEVLAANAEFYRAFSARDLAAMDSLWAQHAPVACVHPGWEALRGRSEVMASFRAILGSPTSPPISSGGATASVLGDTAYVLCTEAIEGDALVATNVFTREDGAWKLVHHHAGPVARRSTPAGPGARRTKGALN